LGVFGRVTPEDPYRLQKFKTRTPSGPPIWWQSPIPAARTTRLNVTLAGSKNDYKGDAAWLDIVWASISGPSRPINGKKTTACRTVYAKHNKGVNVIYVDGHAARSLPSKLNWGQFYGIFDNMVMLPNNARPNHRSASRLTTLPNGPASLNSGRRG
jgi:prepilin-type processing-associated H-X9-DG protein